MNLDAFDDEIEQLTADPAIAWAIVVCIAFIGALAIGIVLLAVWVLR